MDDFEALLAKRPAAAPPADEGDPFAALLAKRTPAAPALAASPAGAIPVDTSLQAPPKTGQDPSTLGKLVRGKGTLETAADLGDIVVGGFPAMLLGTVGEVTQRVSSIFDGRGYREGAKAGAEFSRAMGEKFGRPIFDNLVAAGLLDKETRSVPMQAMDKVGGWLENAATIVEHDTGGKISKEDYLASVNGFMAAMGVKGFKAAVQHGVQVPGIPSLRIKGLKERIAESNKSAWDTALERYQAEEQLAKAQEAEGLANRTTTPVADAAKARLLRKDETPAGRTPQQARKDARAAFSTPEAGEQAGLIDRQAAYREELAAQEATLRDRFPPSGERTGSRDAVDLTLDGKETPTTYAGNQPFHTADTTAALKRGIVADTPIQTEGRLSPAARPALDTALEKVKGGRLFDMTAEERIALRNSVDITDPKVITAAAVGATGLGLAMAYEPSAEEAAMAIGAGALLRRGGKGETMREVLARPETTPLGALLEASAYTTSALEKLADSAPGKFEFKKAQVEQLLKREGVTKHEREVMQAALAEIPRDTVTAKELMVGLKMATKDFELGVEKTDHFAETGLENIERTAPEGYSKHDIEAAQLGKKFEEGRYEVVDRYGDLLVDLQVPFHQTPQEAFAAWKARQLEIFSSDNAPTTRVYKSPLRTSANNHFSDPNYFGHTRSFEEGGVRHVVEIQSDLAQKVGKIPKPEEIAAAKERLADVDRLSLISEEAHTVFNDTGSTLRDYVAALKRLEGAYGADVWEDVKLRLGHEIDQSFSPNAASSEHAVVFDRLSKKGDYEGVFDYVRAAIEKAASGRSLNLSGISTLSSAMEAALWKESRRLNGTRNELQAMLAESSFAPLAPMLKDWHKRLVREELADAARNLERSVRFATADTMAKVEGWPENVRAEETVSMHQEFVRQAEARLAAVARTGEDTFLERRHLAEMRAQLEHVQKEAESSKNASRFSPHVQGIYDRYSRDVEKFLRQLGGQPYTDASGHTWLEVPLGEAQRALPGGGARTQIGGIDPQLAKGVAAVGGTAALAAWLSRDKDKAKHAAMAGILTGLGLLLKSRVPAIGKMVEQTLHGVQQVAGNLSTDAAVTAPLLRRLTEHARAELKGIHDAGRAVAPFLEIASQLPARVQKELNVALMNGRTTDIIAAVGKAATPGLLKEWNNVQAQLKKFGAELQSVGLLKELRPDYYPRIVKDLPGLLNAIGKEYAVPLQRVLDAAEKRAGAPLDEGERAGIINRFIEKNLRGQTGQGKPSFFKRRTINDVSIDLEPFYVEPLQALPLYIGSAVRAIEKARFFGRDAVKDPTTGKLDLTASIGNVVAKEIDAGNLTPENFKRLTGVLQTRFGPAYESPARPLQVWGQLTNIALLGNVFSGMMNLADMGTIAAQHGVVPLAAALSAKLGNRLKITAADVGMAEHIMEEFVYGTRDPVKMKIPLTERTVQLSMAKALDATFRFSGFKAFDTVMQEAALNAAFEKYTRLSRTKAGEARIQRQYSDYFTSDMPQLLADLRAGAKTKLTVELAFRELSDAQPVTKVEMPQFYLDHPNLRFGFALKSFMIKQINLLRRRGIDEIRRGNKREGIEFLMRYTLMAGAAGATMDWVTKSLLGREADTDWKMIPLNALKNLGLSEYVIDKARQGKGKEAIIAATLPPVDPIINLVTADPQAVRYIPLVGRLAYDRLMDGAEKANAAKRAAEKKKKLDAARTPDERRELEQRALERRKALVRGD